MSTPISDYQTAQRNCQLRWNIFDKTIHIRQYIENKTVLDIGCAQGWFVKKSLEYGAKNAIGIDIANYDDNIVISAELFDISSEVNTIFLMSVDVDINIVEKIFKTGNVETVFFEPYLDYESKSKWKEDEWLQRFRECGYVFFKCGISERDRSLYMLRRTNVHMIIRNIEDGKIERKYAIKKNVDNKELEFYKKFGNKEEYKEYVLPYQIEKGKNGENNLILQWAESTLSLSNNPSLYIKAIKKSIDWIHYLEIVHGDLRISNIVIYNNKPYLIDFSNWHYGNIYEDNGFKDNGTLGKRGFEYIKNALLSGKVRYLE